MDGKLHHRAKDLTGVSWAYLKIIGYAGSDGKKTLWKAKCSCGKIKIIDSSEIKKKKQKSCGCKRKELIGKNNTKHGMARHPAYAVWRSMVDRCKLPTHQAWHNYGARGV